MQTKTLKIDSYGKSVYRKVPAIGEKVTFDGPVSPVGKPGAKGIPANTFCTVIEHRSERGQVYIKVINPVDKQEYEVEYHKLHWTILKSMQPKKMYLKHKFGDKP